MVNITVILTRQLWICRLAVRMLRRRISGLSRKDSVRFQLKWVPCLEAPGMQFVDCCSWR